MRSFGLTLGALFSVVACTGTLGDAVDDDSRAGPSGSSVGPGSGATGGGGSTGGELTGGTGGFGGSVSAGGMGGSGGDPAVLELCERWRQDRMATSEGSWSGSVASCEPGDVSGEGRANALRQLNLYRWIAGLPEVTTDPSRDAGAQACALMMHANPGLSHDPPPTWNCYTTEGAQAAGLSNISTGPGVRSVDAYMSDFGNTSTMGHRRWILSNSLGPVGLGSTSSASCMWVIGGSGNAGQPWQAWPSPGPFPIEALTTSFQSVDVTGWTIQSDAMTLGGAQVSVTDDGVPVPVDVFPLSDGFGSSSAIRIVPQGWTSQPGHVYRVSVTNVGQPIDYEVEMVECEQP